MVTNRSYARSFAAAAAMMAAGAGTAQAFSMEEGNVPWHWDVSAAWMPDMNLRAGDTDKGGDRKQAQIVLRRPDGFLFGFNTGIVTPQGVQKGGRVVMRDTGFAHVIVGTESPALEYQTRYGIYAQAGFTNGYILDGWQELVKVGHGGKARTSAASSGFRADIGVSGRADRAIPLASIDDTVMIDANVAGFGQLGTSKISAGVGAFVSLHLGDNGTFRPNLPGMPLTSNKGGITVYGGLIAEARAYDVTTHRLGTQPFTASGVFGASASLKNFTLFGQYEMPLTDSVKDGYKPRAHYGTFGINTNF